MKTPEPVISIVIPVRNEGLRVADAIKSFASGRSTLFPLEFVIVDDASEDGCCDELESLLTWEGDSAFIRVLRLTSWVGIPCARNRGAAVAQAPILFITDANVEACADWDLSVFGNLAPGRALCVAIGDKYSAWRGYGCMLDLSSMSINWLLNPHAFGAYVPVSPCAGTVLYAELFRRLGGYDTAMPAYGAAEPEFSIRLWLYGAEIILCPDLLLLHRFRSPEERKPFLERIGFLQTMNYLRFGMLYLDEKGIARLLNHWSRAAPDHFTSALERVETSSVWERRYHLKRNLSYDFAWFRHRFGL